MILANYIVWKNKKAIPISNIAVGDKIAVLAEDHSVTQATVKSIIPVHSACKQIQHTGGPTLILALNSTILSDVGMISPVKGDLIVCGTYLHRVISTKELLTRKQFYDIMIDVDLPVILQDGFCIKVKCKR